jgi:hypothetical protein
MGRKTRLPKLCHAVLRPAGGPDDLPDIESDDDDDAIESDDDIGDEILEDEDDSVDLEDIADVAKDEEES